MSDTGRPLGPQFQRPDPKSELVFSTHDVRRSAGEMKEFERTVAAPSRMGTDVLAVAHGEELALDLRFEAVSEGVLVTGTVETQLTGECTRCLEPLTSDVNLDLVELFLYPENVTDASEDSDELAIVEEMIDLEPVIRDAIVLDLPFNPVCREDCLGLCPTCGAVLNDDPEHSHGEAVDARWSGLAELLDKGDVDE